MLQNTITATFASSSSRSRSHHHICQASSLFSISPFGFHPTWISYGNLNWDGKWEDFVFIFTLYPHMVMWPSEKTYGLKLWTDGHEAISAFHSGDSSPRKWFPLYHSHINVLIFTYCNKGSIFSYIYIYIYYWFLSFEIIDSQKKKKKFWNHRLPLLLLLIDSIGYICILKIKIYKM